MGLLVVPGDLVGGVVTHPAEVPLVGDEAIDHVVAQPAFVQFVAVLFCEDH